MGWACSEAADINLAMACFILEGLRLESFSEVGGRCKVNKAFPPALDEMGRCDAQVYGRAFEQQLDDSGTG